MHMLVKFHLLYLKADFKVQIEKRIELTPRQVINQLNNVPIPLI